MAKYGNGVNYAKTLTPSSENIIDPGLIGGKVRVMQDYAAVTTEFGSAGYIVVGTKLPTGAQVISVAVGGTMTALASSSNVQVGDEGDSDRYLSLSSCAANIVTWGPNVAGGMYYSVTGTTDNYIRLTVPTGSAVSTGTVKITVMYTVE